MSKTPNDVIEMAKHDTRKGSYAVYEIYKQSLLNCCSTSKEYEEYCKRLTKALRV